MDYLRELMNGSALIEQHRKEIVRTIEILAGMIDEKVASELVSRYAVMSAMYGFSIEWSINWGRNQEMQPVPNFNCIRLHGEASTPLFEAQGSKILRDVPLINVMEVHNALGVFVKALVSRSRTLDSKLRPILYARNWIPKEP